MPSHKNLLNGGGTVDCTYAAAGDYQRASRADVEACNPDSADGSQPIPAACGTSTITPMRPGCASKSAATTA